jgi:hypothetical protein
MGDILRLLGLHLRDCFRSRRALEAENTILRHQLGVLRRKSSNRVRLTRFDRFIFTLLYKFSPKTLGALHIVQPETVIRWHRMGSKHCGAGNRDRAEGDQRFLRKSVILSAR